MGGLIGVLVCRHNQEISFKSHPSRLIRKARANWTVCFERQEGAKRLQIEKDNWTQIHQVLNTRRFGDTNAAGVCCDMDTANSYVRDQLARFEC